MVSSGTSPQTSIIASRAPTRVSLSVGGGGLWMPPVTFQRLEHCLCSFSLASGNAASDPKTRLCLHHGCSPNLSRRIRSAGIGRLVFFERSPPFCGFPRHRTRARPTVLDQPHIRSSEHVRPLRHARPPAAASSGWSIPCSLSPERDSPGALPLPQKRAFR